MFPLNHEEKKKEHDLRSPEVPYKGEDLPPPSGPPPIEPYRIEPKPPQFKQQSVQNDNLIPPSTPHPVVLFTNPSSPQTSKNQNKDYKLTPLPKAPQLVSPQESHIQNKDHELKGHPETLQSNNIPYQNIDLSPPPGQGGARKIPTQKRTRITPVQERTRKPPIQKRTRMPSVQERTRKPPVQERTRKLPVQERTRKPPVQERTRKPPVQERTRKPPVQERTRKPPVQERTRMPSVQERTRKPPVQERTRKPPVQERTRKPSGQDRTSPPMSLRKDLSTEQLSRSRLTPAPTKIHSGSRPVPPQRSNPVKTKQEQDPIKAVMHLSKTSALKIKDLDNRLKQIESGSVQIGQSPIQKDPGIPPGPGQKITESPTQSQDNKRIKVMDELNGLFEKKKSLEKESFQ